MSISVTYVAMPKSKVQKSRYLRNETFFFQIKKFINYSSRAAIWLKTVS